MGTFVTAYPGGFLWVKLGTRVRVRVRIRVRARVEMER